jgi:hypothetical protein
MYKKYNYVISAIFILTIFSCTQYEKSDNAISIDSIIVSKPDSIFKPLSQIQQKKTLYFIID